MLGFARCPRTGCRTAGRGSGASAGPPPPLEPERIVIQRVVVVAVIAFLSAAGSGRVDEKKPPKAPLPREDSVKWDVATFEDSATFTATKRDVKNGEVVWVLENRKDLAVEHVFGYHAEFLDEDGVKLFAVAIGSEPFPPNLRLGERNRFVLELPKAEKWKNVKKVVIKTGAG